MTDNVLTILTDLLILINDLQNNGHKTINGQDIDVLYDDLAMIHDRTNPELNDLRD